jgi:mono/diheme cytochrome c family protein
MRDILFSVVMLSLPAAAAMIAGKTLFAVSALEADEARVKLPKDRAAALYADHCAACHGGAAEGGAGGPALTALDTHSRMGRDAIATAIRTGVAEPEGTQPPMPAFPELTGVEVRGLIEFIDSRREGRSG